MAVGDDALAAGMDIVPGTLPANQIDTEINKTRDYLAQRVAPVDKGGTGSTSAAAARAALGITAANVPTSGSNVQNELNALNGAMGNVYPKNIIDGVVGTLEGNANGRVAKSGDTMSGNLFLPNSSAATSGFTVCYINGDGRVSRGSSARKYKKHIHEIDPASLGDLFARPLYEYQMRADGTMPDDQTYHVGEIADDLIGTDLERFVVVINDEVESIDFIALLLARTHALHARLERLENAHAEG